MVLCENLVISAYVGAYVGGIMVYEQDFLGHFWEGRVLTIPFYQTIIIFFWMFHPKKKRVKKAKESWQLLDYIWNDERHHEDEC